MSEQIEQLIRQRLNSGQMMQLATIADEQPWCCTVYYVADEALNIYWISKPERRHSKEIQSHQKAAAAIPIEHTYGEDVVGLSIEGVATLIENPEEISKAIRLYTNRYDRGEDFYNDFLAGKNSHKLYRLTPRLIVLFDEENFPDDPRKELFVKPSL
jgi:uncharacterized protein YhbP (UPF0306 family)